MDGILGPIKTKLDKIDIRSAKVSFETRVGKTQNTDTETNVLAPQWYCWEWR